MALVADISLAPNSRKAMALLATPMAEAGSIVEEAQRYRRVQSATADGYDFSPCVGRARGVQKLRFGVDEDQGHVGRLVELGSRDHLSASPSPLHTPACRRQNSHRR